MSRTVHIQQEALTKIISQDLLKRLRSLLLILDINGKTAIRRMFVFCPQWGITER